MAVCNAGYAKGSHGAARLCRSANVPPTSKSELLLPRPKPPPLRTSPPFHRPISEYRRLENAAESDLGELNRLSRCLRINTSATVVRSAVETRQDALLSTADTQRDYTQRADQKENIPRQIRETELDGAGASRVRCLQDPRTLRTRCLFGRVRYRQRQ
jgi:hypothetical protein